MLQSSPQPLIPKDVGACSIFETYYHQSKYRYSLIVDRSSPDFHLPVVSSWDVSQWKPTRHAHVFTSGRIFCRHPTQKSMEFLNLRLRTPPNVKVLKEALQSWRICRCCSVLFGVCFNIITPIYVEGLIEDQFSSVPWPIRSSGNMRDDSAEIVFQPFLHGALLSSSGTGRDVHSLLLSIQHFLCRPRRRPPSRCLEGWLLWRNCRGVWRAKTIQVSVSWRLPEEVLVDSQGNWSYSASSRWSNRRRQ